MNIFKNKTSKVAILTIIVLLALSFSLMIFGNVSAFAAETNISIADEKIYCNASIDENFDGNTIIVVMNKTIGGINKRQDKTLFKGIEVESITDITVVEESIKGKKYLNEKDFRQILEVKLPIDSKTNVLNVIKQIEKINGVYSAEPNYYGHASKLPANSTGTSYPHLWGLHDANYGIDAPLAWELTTGSKNIQVAVIDTGIAAHASLNANLVTGQNFVNNSNDTNDTDGHGTHIAGTIGATENTLNGVVGINWNIALVPLKISNTGNEWLTTRVISAITWARNNGIPIINFSGGGFGPSSLNGAISSYAGLFVCSAGNDGTDNDVTKHYPSDYSIGQSFSNRVISVGAINQNGAKSSFSNYGKQSVSIFAPGEKILSTSPFGAGYATMSGTSMAAPHVAGVAALMLSYNTYLTPAEIKTAIMANDDDLSSLSELCVSGGRVNAYKALSSLHKTQEVFNDFGYTGSTYHWHGAVRMNYDGDDAQNTLDGLKVIDKTQLEFELMTLSSSNAISTINGTINFELKNSAGASIQTHTSTVNVSAFNNIELGNNTFTINTFNLENGTYTLTFKSNFNRAFWSESIEKTYTFVVNQPTKVIGDFGYTTSWYRWNGKVDLQSDSLHLFTTNSSNQLVVDRGTNLNFTLGTDFAYNAWNEIVSTVTFKLRDSEGNTVNIGGNYSHTSTVRVGIVSNVTFTNRSFSLNAGSLPNDTYTLTLDNTSTRNGETYTQTKTFTFVINISCVAEGSLITLADGTQKAVEELTGGEQLLVWNLFTGTFDTAHILFIDSDAESVYEVINLGFSDGTSVKVISEHAFWDFDLNKYVFLRRDAAQYIGHWFNKQTTDADGNMTWTRVQLISVDIQNEVTTAWSPVTYGHLCYYVNGMLSMPGATEGLINILDVNPDTMKIDETAYNADIAEYGLFTYAEFAETVPIPEEIFDAFGGQYFKVAIGKGILTWDMIANLVERYAVFF